MDDIRRALAQILQNQTIAAGALRHQARTIINSPDLSAAEKIHYRRLDSDLTIMHYKTMQITATLLQNAATSERLLQEKYPDAGKPVDEPPADDKGADDATG